MDAAAGAVQAPPLPARRGPFRASTVALFVAIGAFTLAAQTLLFREHLTSLRGDELGIALFFGSWLGWIGCGAALAALFRRRRWLPATFLWVSASYPVLAAVQGLLLVELRTLADVRAFEVFPLARAAVATLLCNAPVSLATGWVFLAGCVFVDRQRVSGDHFPSGQLAARLYALEALGSFVGGASVTALLWAAVAPVSILAAATLMLAVPVVAVAWGSQDRAVAGLAAATALVAAVALLTPLGPKAQDALYRARWAATMPGAALELALETPYQQVAVARLGAQTVFVANGAIVASSADAPMHTANAALLFAQRPRARRVLLLGTASAGLVAPMLRYDPERIDVVMVDGRFFEATSPFRDDTQRQALDDPRVVLHFEDGRDTVRRAAEEGSPPWDLVLVDLPDPDTASISRFYTVDFYRDLAAVLAADGVFATTITAGENFAGTEVLQLGRSVFRSVDEVFADVAVSPGEVAWILASPTRGQVALDPLVLEARFRAMAARDPSVPPEVFTSMIAAERVAATRLLFEGTGGDAPASLLNRDTRPVTLFFALLVAAKQSGVDAGAALRAARAIGLPLFLVPLIVFVLLRLRFRVTTATPAQGARFNGATLLAVCGGIAMSLGVLLLLAFQSRFGHVFVSIGALNALLMLGLFLGGFLGSQVLRRLGPRLRFAPVYGALAPTAALCAAMPWVVDALAAAPHTTALVLYHGLFLVAGALAGLAFPVAGYYLERSSQDTGLVAGLLESVDHWGGALGALLVGVLAVPVLGIGQSSLLMVCALAGVGVLFGAEQVAAATAGRGGVLAQRVRRWARRAQLRHRRDRGRSLVYVAIGLLLCVGAASVLIGRRLDAPRVHLEPAWVKARFGAPHVEAREQPFVHYRTVDEAGGALREVVLLSRATGEVEGYGGPVNVLVAWGGDGELREARLAESNETPAYLVGFDDWLGGLAGWPLGRPLRLGAEIDALTGATITSRALVESIESTRVATARSVFGLDSPQAATPTLWESVEPGGVALLAALLVAVGLFLWAGQRWRLALLVVNVALFGAVLNLQFSMVHVVRLAHLDLPAPAAGQLFVLAVGVLVLSLGFGQLYCGYLCPFGAAQELLGRLGLVRRPNREGGALRYVKFGVLWVVLVGAFAGCDELLAMDPLSLAFAFDDGAAAAVLLGLIGLFSLFYVRFWCRFLCPVGAFLALFNRLAPALRWARPKVYARCDLGVRNKWDVDCLQCNRCLAGRLEQGRPQSTEPAAGRVAVVDEGGGRVTRARAAARVWFRDVWNVTLLVGVLATLLAAGSMTRVGTAEEASETGALGEVREVEVDTIRRQIAERRLSAHEAMFYRRLDVEAPDSGQEPTIPLQ